MDHAWVTEEAGNAAGQGLMRKAAENAITLIIIAAIPVRFEAMNELSQDFAKKITHVY